jgi:hypothetical protein
MFDGVVRERNAEAYVRCGELAWPRAAARRMRPQSANGLQKAWILP